MIYRQTQRRPSLNRWVVLILIAAVVVLVALAAGCSSPPKHGRVIQKQYIAAHYDYWQTNDCIRYVTTYSTYRNPNGSVSRIPSTRCVAYILNSHRRWVNDAWGLRLQDGDHTGYRYVDAITYGLCNVGQFYADNGTCS